MSSAFILIVTDNYKTEEVVFLAPLDQVSERGQAKVLLGLAYIWDVYWHQHSVSPANDCIFLAPEWHYF